MKLTEEEIAEYFSEAEHYARYHSIQNKTDDLLKIETLLNQFEEDAMEVNSDTEEVYSTLDQEEYEARMQEIAEHVQRRVEQHIVAENHKQYELLRAELIDNGIDPDPY